MREKANQLKEMAADVRFAEQPAATVLLLAALLNAILPGAVPIPVAC
jgi:hypothetical protein